MVSNCSLVSLFYLKVLPDSTAWALLAIIVLWDMFAVLTPCGPLKQVTGFAQDYGEDILRFLMFSTGQAEPQNEPEEEDGAKESEAGEVDEEEEQEEDSETLKSRFYSPTHPKEELRERPTIPEHPLEDCINFGEAEELLEHEGWY